MRSPCIYVCPAVDQQSHSFFRWNKRSQRRSFHPFDPSYQHLASNQDRSGTAGGYKSVRLLLFDHVHSDHNGRLFLFADGVYRRFRRFDHILGMYYFYLFFFICIFFKFFFYHIFLAYQKYFYIFSCLDSLHRPLYDLCGSVVSAHSVHCHFYDFRHFHPPLVSFCLVEIYYNSAWNSTGFSAAQKWVSRTMKTERPKVMQLSDALFSYCFSIHRIQNRISLLK